MIVRYRKTGTASLLSFLQTGELGPLTRGMTMSAVSELLGPPDWWMDGVGEAAVPLLWGYRPFLEILFERKPPHPLRMIKVPRLPLVARKSIRMARLRVATNGFHDEMRLSDFLRRNTWGKDDEIVVGRCTGGNPVIDICTRNIRLVWSMSIGGEEILQRESEVGLSKAAYLARRDQLSDGFFGIYSSRSPELDRAPQDGWENFSVDQYLELTSSIETVAK
ncbi:hypothetical protein ELI02_06650 [Rhizobium leguminosarum]|uniref:hypothetical protein n=1 Tax=Rhizobium leguminosarum TaxID=384 RepID=UPI001031A402|nr:hypothetical protein [Rhizobium leguminosarum]TAX54946.1 hypothetical protein ELI01_06775 [Rhizobium leguminosarum]TAX59706.1 hypothetical protein ELI02_06650 [Rhizobium leguminosarum]TAY00812.1 hypothetical protein ELH95_06650 [Rhizobium leguminosarum]